jgi:hypothetical protein
MTPSWHEAPVSLEKLDGHLKALLRLKIREFVHLSPWFKEPPTVDPTLFIQRSAFVSSQAAPQRLADEHECPHRKQQMGRRHVRASVRMTVVK